MAISKAIFSVFKKKAELLNLPIQRGLYMRNTVEMISAAFTSWWRCAVIFKVRKTSLWSHLITPFDWHLSILWRHFFFENTAKTTKTSFFGTEFSQKILSLFQLFWIWEGDSSWFNAINDIFRNWLFFLSKSLLYVTSGNFKSS